jgi:hypothetical protein
MVGGIRARILLINLSLGKLIAQYLGKGTKPKEVSQHESRASAKADDEPDAEMPKSRYMAPTDKLKCRYRKSCYTGESLNPAPAQVLETIEETRPETKSEKEGGKYSEGQLKLLCKYRTSCYEKMGINEMAKGKKKAPTILTSKPSRTMTESTTANQRKLTVQEIAEATVRQVGERDKHVVQHPKTQLSPGKQLLLDTQEALKSKVGCKYR